MTNRTCIAVECKSDDRKAPIRTNLPEPLTKPASLKLRIILTNVAYANGIPGSEVASYVDADFPSIEYVETKNNTISSNIACFVHEKYIERDGL